MRSVIFYRVIAKSNKIVFSSPANPSEGTKLHRQLSRDRVALATGTRAHVEQLPLKTVSVVVQPTA